MGDCSVQLTSRSHPMQGGWSLGLAIINNLYTIKDLDPNLTFYTWRTILGSNNEANVKLKPVVGYHSENPRAMKDFAICSLPVIWPLNRKSWVTEYFSTVVHFFFALLWNVTVPKITLLTRHCSYYIMPQATQ